MNCVFCRIAAGTLPSTKVFEDSSTLAIMDINPLTPGHLLVLPKAHIENLFAADEESVVNVIRVVVRIAKAIGQALKPEGLNLLQANGRAAFQSVPHLHFHLIPRRTGDGAGFDWKPVPGDLDAVRRLGDGIRAALG
jgi:histidine triad (HIT) family protein